jgi:hypothetical protein
MTRALALVALLLLSGVAGASQTTLTGAEGHPRSRLPLRVHVASFGDAGLDEAGARAVDDWNDLAREVLGATAFASVLRPQDAQIVVRVEPPGAASLMGVTELATDGGIIRLPVRIAVVAPQARGQVSRDLVLYQVLAHELGHALGLAHVADPRSLMCCASGEVNLEDPATREAYVAARRRPDVRSARAQLAEHYRRFWTRAP